MINLFDSDHTRYGKGIDIIYSYMDITPKLNKVFSSPDARIVIDELSSLLFAYWKNYSSHIIRGYIDKYAYLVSFCLDQGNYTCNSVYEEIKALKQKRNKT